jgi:Pentapeptide repeats (9 copies)
MRDNTLMSSKEFPYEKPKPLETKFDLKITGDSDSLELKKCSISEDVRGTDGKRVPVVVANRDFSHYTFEDFGARQVVFNNCIFSYCVFTRAYFYGAKFTDCRFVGARFTDCNFRSAIFSGCDFSYASFRGTIISRKEIAVNFPSEPNIRRELLQALRANAISIADDAGAKFFIWEELKAGEEHNRKAREAKEFYYAKKYQWKNNKREWALVRLERPWLWLQRFGWGYGERPLRLLRSISLLLGIFTILVSWNISENFQQFAGNLYKSAKFTIAVFLGIPFGNLGEPLIVSLWLVSFIALTRYITLSLFVTLLFRRLSRR